MAVRRWPLLLLAVLLLAGCGPRPAPRATPPTPWPTTRADPSPTPTDAPLRVMGHFRGENEPRMRALLEQFARREGITVEYEGVEQLPEGLRARLEEGQIPDLLFLPVPDWLPELVAAGLVVPLDDGTARVVTEQFGPAWVELVQVDDTLYGVPFDANGKSLLWYRPVSGVPPPVPPPTTLDALEAYGQTVRNGTGIAPFAVAGGSGWPLTDWFENVLLAEGGVALYDALRAHQIAWTDPAVERVARRFSTLLQPANVMDGREGILNLPLHPGSFARVFDPDEPGALFWLGAGSSVERLIDESGLDSALSFEILPFPTGGGIVGIGSVAVALTDRTETLALLAYLATPESVLPWVGAGGFISPNLAVPPSAYPSARARQEAALVGDAPLFRYDLSDRLPPKLGGLFLQQQLQRMLTEPERLSEILEEIEVVATREQGRPTAAR